MEAPAQAQTLVRVQLDGLVQTVQQVLSHKDILQQVVVLKLWKYTIIIVSVTKTSLRTYSICKCKQALTAIVDGSNIEVESHL